MVMVVIGGKMGRDISDSGKIMCGMGKDALSILTALSEKVYGRMIKRLV